MAERKTKRTSAPAGPLARSTAEAITVFRTRAGLAAHEMCERAGMNYPYYNSRFHGRAPLTLNDVEQLAAVLGVSSAEISRTAAALQSATQIGAQP